MFMFLVKYIRRYEDYKHSLSAVRGPTHSPTLTDTSCLRNLSLIRSAIPVVIFCIFRCLQQKIDKRQRSQLRSFCYKMRYCCKRVPVATDCIKRVRGDGSTTCSTVKHTISVRPFWSTITELMLHISELIMAM